MIREGAKQYCCEDLSLIENYNEAVADKENIWVCHHRKETDLGMKSFELMANGLYFNRPASELIFLTRDVHAKLHAGVVPVPKVTDKPLPRKKKNSKYSVIMHITPELKVFIGMTNRPTWIYEGHWRGSAIEYEAAKFGWNNINHVLVEDNLTKEEAKAIRKRLIEKAGRAGLNQRTANKVKDMEKHQKSGIMKKEKQTALMTSTVNGVKLSLTFDNRYESKNGYPVVVRVYKDREWTYVSTGFSMSANEFRKCDGDTLSILEKKYNTVKDWCMKSVSDGTFSVKGARECLKNSGGSDTLEKLIRLKMETVVNEGTRRNYLSTIRFLLKVFPSGLATDKVNHLTIGEFADRMKQEGLSDTTANVYLSVIKASINYAIYKGLFKQENYPFKKNAWECDKVVIPKSAKRQDRWITSGEIQSIWDSFAAHPKKISNKWVGVFLFSYLTGGMNLADIVNLKFSKEFVTKDVLRFTRKKTAHRNSNTIVVPVSSHLKRLLEIMHIEPVEGEPVFPFLSGEYFKCKSNASSSINRALEKYGVTMTWARHSFCTNMNKMGAPFSMVEAAMGHAATGVASHYIAPYTTDEMLPWFEKLL